MFFNRKKNKKNAQLDEAFAKVTSEIERIEDWENPRKLEQYILDSCEQIITMTREVESEKSQYRVVTEYLTDIKKVQDLSSEQTAELKEVFHKIKTLSKSKEAYEKKESRLSDEQFFIMEEHEDTILGDIHRMQENEIYQTKVERDMRFLESEKSRWEIERDELLIIGHRCKILSIIFFIEMIASIFGFLVLQEILQKDFQLPGMIGLFAGAIAVFIIYLYSSGKRKEARNALRELNQSISLLNIVRMKYANVTKAIHYEQEMYQVRTSQELHYLWEQYLLMVKEEEKFRQDNIDLQYYIERFQKFMQKLDLHNPKIWMSQVRVLMKPESLDEINQTLLVRRQKIRDRIAENTKEVKRERDEIDRLMREHNYYVPEIMEIITSVDRMCGLSNLGKANVESTSRPDVMVEEQDIYQPSPTDVNTQLDG